MEEVFKSSCASSKGGRPLVWGLLVLLPLSMGFVVLFACFTCNESHGFECFKGVYVVILGECWSFVCPIGSPKGGA